MLRRRPRRRRRLASAALTAAAAFAFAAASASTSAQFGKRYLSPQLEHQDRRLLRGARESRDGAKHGGFATAAGHSDSGGLQQPLRHLSRRTAATDRDDVVRSIRHELSTGRLEWQFLHGERRGRHRDFQFLPHRRHEHDPVPVCGLLDFGAAGVTRRHQRQRQGRAGVQHPFTDRELQQRRSATIQLDEHVEELG